MASSSYLNYIKSAGFRGSGAVQFAGFDLYPIRADLSLMFLSLPEFFSSINKQYAVQVVDLVLEDARQPTFGLDGHRSTMPVQSLDRHCFEAFHISLNTWG